MMTATTASIRKRPSLTKGMAAEIVTNGFFVVSNESCSVRDRA
jgi:hypothetical protein